MSNRFRECLQCGDPIEGRPNKKFCSEICKGRYFRENNPEAETSTTDPELKQSVELIMHKSPISEDEIDESEDELDNELTEQIEREEAEKKARMDKLRAANLHEQFCDLVQEFLEIEGKVLTARPAARFQNAADKLTAAYREHPYLKLPENLVRNRLKALYDIHDIIQEVGQEIADKNAFQAKESSFEITNKWRKLLRKLLIAD